jgi:glycyl-tRNA synthetase beta chain
MTVKNLLVELFVEELPPKDLKKFGESFANVLVDSLKKQGLCTDHSATTSFASPRRLAVHVSAVRAQADEKAQSLKLVPVSVGLNAEGQPTPALLKKLASVGADASVVPTLTRKMDGKAEALFYDHLVKGVTLSEGLQKAFDETLAALPIRKVMQYQLQDGWSSVKFVRPAHGLVALHGAEVVPLSALGLSSGRETHGHRFEAKVDPIELLDADHYARQLEEQGAVMASFAARHSEITRQLQHAAAQLGLVPIDDAALLDEVTALVERPNVLLCQFEPEFLEVPQECLILTMKVNQKYFPLLDSAGKLQNKFLIVSNIRPEDPSRVIEGNERVVRPRLADAKFFFDQDRKKTLESRVSGLDKVVYHGKLGTQGDRTKRVQAIAGAIASAVALYDGVDQSEALVRDVKRAALLAKADLLTDMVGEFPELQGVMGGYYARHDGESKEVAWAIEDHYKPRFAGDELPRERVGEIVALADKLETLVGLFGIGQLPTGDKDPFALRRHALGVVRLLTERITSLPLDAALDLAMTKPEWPESVQRVQVQDGGATIGLRSNLLKFFEDRLAVALRDQGASAQEVEAALADDKFWRLADVPKRLEALRIFSSLPEAASLAAANKRVVNILKKADGSTLAQVDQTLLLDPAENDLHDALVRIGREARQAFDQRDYTASLCYLAALKAPVDNFFDKVMVNAEDAKVRANRLGLLAILRDEMNRVADLSKLAT